MKNLKTFVVSAITENHFFSTLEEAEEDLEWGVQTCEKENITGEIELYELPENLDENIDEDDYFINCLENGTAQLIDVKTV